MKFAFRLLCVIGMLTAAAPAATVMDLRTKDDAWFGSEEGKKTVDNVIAHQRDEGGWKKSYDLDSSNTDASKKSGGSWDASTIDNGATYTELRVLGRACTHAPRPVVLKSFDKGLDFLLSMQYPNGGWPQRFPPPRDYGRYITFNDDAMTNVLTLLDDIARPTKDFEFVDSARRAKAKAALDRGIALILKTQINGADGKLTGWAQQYDEKTLEPVKARSYELPAICGSESAAIMMLLMQQEKPTAEMKRAIGAGAAWFDRSKISSKRLDRGGDWLPVDDASAEPLWARYYEIETNRPFYCDRDGVKVYDLAKVSLERRKGYAWLRPWGGKVLAEYEKWRVQHGEGA